MNMIAVDKIQHIERLFYLSIGRIMNYRCTINIKLPLTNADSNFNLKTDKRTYLSANKFILLVVYPLN